MLNLRPSSLRTLLGGALLVLVNCGASFSARASAPPPPAGDHWAFASPQRPDLPPVRHASWPRNAIDHFVLAKLEKEGLAPSPPADKTTLLRRLHLDLIGLPPTLQEIDDFLADTSDQAYERQVERLLASPHYGERWSRHWLDAARYADSDGYEKDMSREVWAYRDYVIDAFNRDLPYNRFIIEQIAGDQLPDATQDQRVATGFLRNSMVNMEGAIDPEQFRMEAMFDRMDALGKGILGLTIQCAQCHTHKYDPMTHEEYYRLFAYINNDHEARPAVYTREERTKIGNLRQEMAALESELKQSAPDWRERLAAWEKSVSDDQPEWIVLDDLHQEGDKSQRYRELNDGSLLAEGYAPTKFTQWFRTTNHLSGIRAFRLEYLNHPNLPYEGPGRSFQGTCALSEFFVEAGASVPGDDEKKHKAKWAEATADFNQIQRALEPNFDDRSTNNRVTGPIRFAIDGNDKTAWGIDAGPGRRNQPRNAVFVAETPLGFESGTEWRIGLQQNHGGWNSDDHMNNNLGRFRLSVTKAENAQADPLPRRVREILSVPRAERTPAQEDAVFSYWRTTVPAWQEANARIDALWDQWPDGATSLMLVAREEERDTHVLNRGDWLQPADAVAPGVPAFLHPLPDGADSSRLTFARWLADEDSPTTARVFVNRVWQAYFGTGIVGTPEDFGVQADDPSHPGLLDWLACEFMEPTVGPAATAPWSIKHVHRLVVSSATYRQSSHVNEELLARDPYNRLLARGPRFRVEGEIVRDIALATSGLLNREIGGPSVMPPAPEFLFQPPASYAPFPWAHEQGPEKYRRALYTFRRRSTPFPMLQTFDVPNADASCVQRQRSNSPLQALVALNEPLFVECAQALARKTLAHAEPTDAARLEYAFRTVLTRRPDDVEKQALFDLLHEQRARFAEGWVNPNEVATGVAAIPKDLPAQATPTQLAAYTVVARVLLNLDETITKE